MSVVDGMLFMINNPYLRSMRRCDNKHTSGTRLAGQECMGFVPSVARLRSDLPPVTKWRARGLYV